LSNEHANFVLRFRLIFFSVLSETFLLTFLRFQTKTKMSGAPHGAPVPLEIFFPVLRETVFAHIFPVSNENENERRTGILSVPDRKRTRTKRMSKFCIINSGDGAMMTSEGLKTNNHEQRR
jgi:hypothetical protein